MSSGLTEAEISFISITSKILQNVAQNDNAFYRAVFVCSIPRWLNRDVIAGMCIPEVEEFSAEEILEKVQSLPFCQSHSTRQSTWVLNPLFRDYLINNQSNTEQKKLHSRAATVFKQLLDAKRLSSEKKFQDLDWQEIATEWVYHLLHVNPDEGLKTVRWLCAQALAQPVYGPMWEVDFCLQFLNGLDWPSEATQVEESIRQLKDGFKALAVYQDVKALAMAKSLAEVPELTLEEKAELHYWIGTVHLYQEGRLAPALEELEQALDCNQKLRAAQSNTSEKERKINADAARIHAAIADVYAPNPSVARYDLALRHTEMARDLAPDRVTGYLALGNTYAAQEKWHQAEEFYKEATRVEPENADGYWALSRVYQATKQVDKARANIKKAVKKDRSYYYDALIRRGDTYFGVRQFDEARKKYSQAKKEFPDRIDAYIALAQLYSSYGSMYPNVGQSDRAERLYQEAIKKAPDMADGYTALATMYENQGKWERAIHICQQAIEKGVNNQKQIYLILSRIYRQQDRLCDLIETQNTIVADPLCGDAFEKYAACCAVGDAYLAKAWKLRSGPGAQGGNPEQQTKFKALAREQFEKALQVDDHRAWAYLSLVRLAVLCKDESEIQKWKAQVREKVPWAQYDLLVGLGEAYKDNFQGEASEKCLKDAIAMAHECEHDCKIAWSDLANLYQWQGNLTACEDAWQHLVEADPTLQYERFITLGQAFGSVGNDQKARELYEAAKALESKTADAYLYLAGLDEQAGDWGAAVKNYYRAATLAPDFAAFCYGSISNIYWKQQDYDNAKSFAEIAIQFDAEQVDGHLALAKANIMQSALEAIKTNRRLLESGVSPDELDKIYRSSLDSVQPDRKRLDKRLSADELYNFDLEIANFFNSELQAYQIAQELYEKLIECTPKNNQKPDSYIGLAQAMLAQKQPQEATNLLVFWWKWYLKIQKERPLKPEVLDFWSISLAYHLTSRSGEATRQYWSLIHRYLTQALKIDGVNVNAYVTLGNFYFAKGDLKKGLNAYKWVYEIEPTQKYNAYLAMGNACEANRHFQDAREYYQKAIDLAPWRQAAYINLAVLLIEWEKHNEAKQVFRAANQAAGLSYSQWASHFESIGKLDEAIRLCCLGEQEGSEQEQRETCKCELKLLVQHGRAEDAFRICREIPSEQAKLKYELYLSTGDSLIELGDFYISQQRSDAAERAYDQAERAYGRAIRENSDLPDAYLRLGQLLADRNRLDEALKVCNQMAQRSERNQYSAFISQGNLWATKEQYEEAKDAYQQAITLDPDCPDAYRYLAQLYEGLQHFEDAIQFYQKAIDVSPEKAQILPWYQELGDLFVQQQRFSEAAEALQQAVQHSSKDSDKENQENAQFSLGEAYFYWGNDYEQQWEFDQALEKYIKATEVYPKHGNAYIAQARIYGRKGSIDKLDAMVQKIRDLIKNLELNPLEEYDASLLIGTAYQEAGVYEKAEVWYRELVEKYPKRSEAFRELAQLLENLQRIDESIHYYHQAAELEFDSKKASNIYECIGNLLIQQGSNSEALKELKQSINCDSENVSAHFARATLYETQGDLDQAIEDYQKILEADRKYISAYLALGRIYKNQHRDKDKNQHRDKDFNQLIQDIFSHSDDRYSGYLLSGAIYEEVNQPEQAEAQYRQAIRQDSVRSEAYIKLIYLFVNQGQIDKAIAVCDEMAQQAELSYDAEVWRGNLFYAQGKLDEAEQSYQQAIARHLERADAYLQLASLYQQQGKPDQSEQILTQGLSEDVPYDPDLYWMLGQLYEQKQQWKQAINWYQKAAEHQFLSEKAAIAFERVGDLLTRQGNDSDDPTSKLAFYDQAQEALQIASLCNPANAGVYFSLGYLNEQKGEWEKALERYHKTIQLDPQYLSAYVSLCRTYSNNRNLAALERIRGQLKDQMEKLQLDTTSRYQLHVAIAQTYTDAELYERAIEELREAIAIEPDLPDAHVNLAWIYELQAQWAKAREEYEKVGQLVPEWQVDVYLRQGSLLEVEENYLDAAQAYQRAIETDPGRADAYLALGRVCVKLNRWEEAESAFRQAINLAPEQLGMAPNAYLFLADLYRMQGRHPEMQEACTRVISLVQGVESPDYNLLRQQGLAYFMRGDYAAAEQALNRALESNPADAQARFYLALDLLCLGQQDQAVAELQQGIDSTPNPWNYDYAIREAEILAARTPEVPGAKEMLQTLIAARDKSAPASGAGLQRDESQQVSSTGIPGDENVAIPALEPNASDL